MGNDHFDLLPEGWIKAFHEIGIPVYLDRHTRNIALSRPYFLGSADLIVRILLFYAILPNYYYYTISFSLSLLDNQGTNLGDVTTKLSIYLLFTVLVEKQSDNLGISEYRNGFI